MQDCYIILTKIEIGKDSIYKVTQNKYKQAGAELCQAQAKLGLSKLAFSLLED
jgi:hypothetical protein